MVDNCCKRFAFAAYFNWKSFADPTTSEAFTKKVLSIYWLNRLIVNIRNSILEASAKESSLLLQRQQFQKASEVLQEISIKKIAHQQQINGLIILNAVYGIPTVPLLSIDISMQLNAYINLTDNSLTLMTIPLVMRGFNLF